MLNTIKFSVHSSKTSTCSENIAHCDGDQAAEKPDSSKTIIYKSLLNDFYNFDDSNTKWILTVLSSTTGIKRLQRHWKVKSKLLRSYYEIPDNPQIYPRLRSNALSKIQTPAFHSLVSLYLNPLGISIYTENENAVNFLLNYKINKISDPIFIQKWWHKGDDKYITDFSATDLIHLMLRRNYFTCLPLFMVNGYNPMNQIFQIDHIQSSDDSKSKTYEDSLDLAMHLLHDLPGLNVGQFLQIISNKKIKTRFNPITYNLDILSCSVDNRSSNLYRLRSIFRLYSIKATDENQEKCFSKYLVILKIIQRLGYFKFINKELVNYYGEVKSDNSDVQLNLDNVKKQKLHFMCEGHFNVNELQSERLNFSGANQKLNKHLFFKLLLQDRQITLMILLSLLNELELKGRSSHNVEMSELLVNILLDNDQLKWLINADISNEILPSINYDCCKIIPKSSLTRDEIENIKFQLINVIKCNKKLTSRVMNLDQNFFVDIMSTKKKNDKRILEIKEEKETINIKKKKDVFIKAPFMFLNSKSIRTWNRSKHNHKMVLGVNATGDLNPSLVSLRQKIAETKQKEDEEKVLKEKKSLKPRVPINKQEVTKENISQKPPKKSQKSKKKSSKQVNPNRNNLENYSRSVTNIPTKLFPPPLILRTTDLTESCPKSEASVVELEMSIDKNYTNHSTEITILDEIQKHQSCSEINTHAELLNSDDDDEYEDDVYDNKEEIQQITSCDISRILSQRVKIIKHKG